MLITSLVAPLYMVKGSLVPRPPDWEGEKACIHMYAMFSM